MNNNPYQSYSREYDHWYDQNRPVYLLELEAVKEALPASGVGLEIGVGTGRFAGPLGVEWGIDLAREMLVRGQERGLRGVQGTGEALPFNSRSFDYVVMVAVLCFLSSPDRVIEEADRALKDGGRLVIGFVDRESYLGRIYQAKKSKSRFYRDGNFYSVPEVLKLFPAKEWSEIAIRQTLFETPGAADLIQVPKEGFGEGGFVVVSGKNKR
ncbi:MAG TPA: class I SAM-dependent methyltransferase [Proteobacteria bacterium]|nr:class I SAM-dependent methyltransferase [Pseudomonadota bacterium]